MYTIEMKSHIFHLTSLTAHAGCYGYMHMYDFDQTCLQREQAALLFLSSWLLSCFVGWSAACDCGIPWSYSLTL